MKPLAALLLLAAPAAAQTLDDTPRLLVLSAFEPEWQALQAAATDVEEHVVHGNRFLMATLEGRPVVLALSGISMVNAAMTTQMLLDRFEVEGIVFSGIAGGVDPSLAIGDVVVAERWGPYLDAVFARETDGAFALPPWMSSDFAPYGMIYTRGVEVMRDGLDAPEARFWFPVHEPWLETAREVAEGLALEACGADGACLTEPPEVVVGGGGRVGQRVRGQRGVPRARVRDVRRQGARHGVGGRGAGGLCQRRAVHRLPLAFGPRGRRRDGERDADLPRSRRR